MEITFFLFWTGVTFCHYAHNLCNKIMFTIGGLMATDAHLPPEFNFCETFAKNLLNTIYNTIQMKGFESVRLSFLHH